MCTYRWGEDGSYPRTRRVGYLGLALFALVLLIGASCYSGALAWHLQHNGVTAQARVTAIVACCRGGTVAVVEFVAENGRTVQAECHWCRDGLEVGDTVRIRYDPSSPRTLLDDAEQRNYRRQAAYTLAAAAALSIVAGILTRPFLRRNRSPNHIGPPPPIPRP